MKSIFKSVIITSLFVLGTTNTFSQIASKEVSITASGSDKTLEDAKQSALRSAIEQAFGAFISSKTEMFNDQVVADQMASVSSGNIKSFSILASLLAVCENVFVVASNIKNIDTIIFKLFIMILILKF